MSKKIKLGVLFPNHLNLNGDSGNLVVLKKRLELNGKSSEIVDVSVKELSTVDFILLGHGSKAAWLDIMIRRPNLATEVSSYVSDERILLAVASGYEFLANEVFAKAVKTIERRSEFVADEFGFVGYLNSESGLPLSQWHRNAFMTLLHGPILAKNPTLADEIIHRAGWVDKPVELRRLDDLSFASRKTAFEH